MICDIINRTYETWYYTLNKRNHSLKETKKLPDPSTSWWPRIPITSWFLKGLYQFAWSDIESLIDADVSLESKVAISCDKYGVIRLHRFPALTPV